MSSVLNDFPSSYADAIGRIQLRPVGAVPGEVRRLEVDVAGRSDAFPVLVRVSDELSVAPVVSLPDAYAWLTPATLTSWGVSVEQVLSDMFANIGALEVEVRSVTDGTYFVEGDVYAGAVWLRPEMVSQLEVAGTPLIWNAGNGATIVTGDADPQAGPIASAILGDRLQNGIELETLAPHRLQDETWVPVAWPADAAAGLQFAERMFASQWYERQRQPLTQQYEQQGIEVNVPEYRVMSTPDGDVVTASACVQGLRNLIAPVDTVILVSEDGTATPYAFDQLNTAPGITVQDANITPPRWLVTA